MSVPDFEVWGMSNRQRPGKITYCVPGADDVGTRTSNVRSMYRSSITKSGCMRFKTRTLMF